MAGSCSPSNFYSRVRPRFSPPLNRANFFGKTYHVDNGTDNLVDLSGLGGLGGHVTGSEDREGRSGGLESIAESGSSQVGADSPSGSKSSNPAVRIKKT
jgi:hypothetical protein